MDFETFRENLARDIKETLEARTGTDFEVEHRTAEKMNGNYEAIVVKPADSEVGVSLNASTLYKDYESGVSYETIAKGATDLADRSLRNQPEFDVDSFKDYDKMKGTLAMEVVSKERNAELLDTVPHKNIEDMSVVYCFVLGETPAGSGTTYIHAERGPTFRDGIREAIDTALSKKPGSFDELLSNLSEQGYEIKRGKHTSVRGNGQTRFIRFRSLGDGYSEKELHEKLEGVARGSEERKDTSPKEKAKPFYREDGFDLLLNMQELPV